VPHEPGPHRQAALQVSPGHQRLGHPLGRSTAGFGERDEHILRQPEVGDLGPSTAAHAEKDDISPAIIAEITDGCEIGIRLDLLPQQDAQPGQRGREETRRSRALLRFRSSFPLPHAL
jgi:hypothetical protein